MPLENPAPHEIDPGEPVLVQHEIHDRVVVERCFRVTSPAGADYDCITEAYEENDPYSEDVIQRTITAVYDTDGKPVDDGMVEYTIVDHVAQTRTYVVRTPLGASYDDLTDGGEYVFTEPDMVDTDSREIIAVTGPDGQELNPWDEDEEPA